MASREWEDDVRNQSRSNEQSAQERGQGRGPRGYWQRSGDDGGGSEFGSEFPGAYRGGGDESHGYESHGYGRGAGGSDWGQARGREADVENGRWRGSEFARGRGFDDPFRIHRGSGPEARYGGQAGAGHHDPDYQRWRDEQMHNLDSEYQAWRQDRYRKFADEFNSWRASRSGGQGQNTTAGTTGTGGGLGSSGAGAGSRR